SLQAISTKYISYGEDVFLGYPLEISVLSPENTTYPDVDVVLSCQFNKEVVKVSFSLDGLVNITFSGDIILTDLSAGDHQLIVYGQDLVGNIEVSDTIVFTIKPYPSILVMFSLFLVGLFGFSLIFHAIRQK
ncbi:MAG: hypothetical protein NWF10_01735, partial [Candidatus Bathyarchaeota archaeon]|nr:hypothetical protein [Candidatus Bathyarchaeota archaeon]